MKGNLFWILLGGAAVYLLSQQSAAAASGQTPAPTVSPVPLGPPNIFTVTCYDANGNPYQIGSGPCPPLPGGATGSWQVSGTGGIPPAVEAAISQAMNS